MENKKKVIPTASNQPMMKTSSIKHRVGRPVSDFKKPNNTTAKPRPNPVAQDMPRLVTQPMVEPITPTVNTEPKVSTKQKTPKIKKLKNKKLPIFIAVGITVILVVIGVVVAINLPQGSSDNSSNTEETAATIPGNIETTEEENKVTEETLDKYAGVSFEGYQQVEDELGTHGAVVVSVKNTSDKRTNLAVDIVAKDEEGNILDQSSLYAEGIEPEQVQTFYTFVYSELSPEQLKSAKFEVNRAYTYSTDGTDETDQVEINIETPQE